MTAPTSPEPDSTQASLSPASMRANPLHAALTYAATTGTPLRDVLVGLAITGVGIAAGFPTAGTWLGTVAGAIAGLTLATVVVVAVRWVRWLHRARFSLRTRRITALASLGVWMVLARVAVDAGVPEHLGGAAMVTWVLLAIGFASKTENEKLFEQHEQIRAQTVNVWNSAAGDPHDIEDNAWVDNHEQDAHEQDKLEELEQEKIDEGRERGTRS